MLIDIVEARVVEDHRLYLRFADGVEGEVDLSRLIRWEGVFAPLRDLPASPGQIRSRAGDGGLAERRRPD
jgi:hypothetical protein